jgi:hypothetical protein
LGEPNLFAYAALFAWIPITAALYVWLRPQLATMIALLGGVMFLPEQTAIDLPALPPFEKLLVTALSAFVCCTIACWRRSPELLRELKPRGLDVLFVIVVLGNFGTALTNEDALVTGPVIREGLTTYDAFAGGVKDLICLYLPFLLARAMIRTSRDLADLMRVLVIAGLVYSAFALIEIRMSPQFHNWFYGFHAMMFAMTVRFGGYRPTVFMMTGLAVAMFFLATAIAAWARWKAGEGKAWVALGLTAVLILCKSTGAIVYGVALLPLVALRERPKQWLPAGLALMVILFPLIRGIDVFPTDTLVGWAGNIQEERARSLWFRFDQEDQLLARARERLVFGWGTYNRNRIFDPESGTDLSITDGDWMIQVGTRGLVGFVALYGVLALSVLIAQRRAMCVPGRRDRLYLGALALISAVTTVDLLPNGLFHNLPFVFAGAIYGASGGIAAAAILAKRRVGAAQPALAPA